MKNIIKLTFVSIMICFLTLLTSCNSKVLDCPTDFSIDINNTLTWSAVEGARSYTISIKGLDSLEDYEKEFQSRKTSYSLAKLDEGDYEIKIKAISYEQAGEDSDWSEVYNFHRDYESGCLFKLINNNSEYEISSAGSASGDVRIDDVYRTLPVTRINDGAFKGRGKITSISLGKYITYIGKNAFYNCSNLKAINIPDAVSFIGEAAFQTCKSLESIEIPSNVTEISPYTFAYCRSLTNVKLSESLLKIGESAFSDCSALEEIVIPNSVKEIGSYTFAGNTKLTRIKLSESLEFLPDYLFVKCEKLKDVDFGDNSNITEIGVETFEECTSLDTITLPNKLEKIGKKAFYGDSLLKNVAVPDSVIKIGVNAFNGTKLYIDAVNNNDKFVYAGNWVVAVINDGTKITFIDESTFKSGVVGLADNLFQSSSLLERVILANSIKVIGEMAFNNCTILWQFRTKDDSQLEYIWDYAFYGDKVLSNLFLQDKLKYIGDQAFRNCELLDNNSLEGNPIVPNSVTFIGTYAFYGTALYNKPNEEGVIYAGNWVVGYTGTGNNVTLDSSTVGIAKYAFYNAENLKSINGLNYVKYINYGAFYNCSSLTVANLNRNLRRIEDFTFYKCVSLYNVSLPLTLEYVGNYAFYKCTNLNNMDFSETRLKSIGVKAFYENINLENVTFPDTLESIDNYAFYKCSTLKEVVMYDSVVYLGDHAFYKCVELTNLVLSNSLSYIPDYAFNGCEKLTSITIPNNVTTIGLSAFNNCTSVTSVSLGNNVTVINNYAFANLSNVDKLILPTSVNSIGSFAFKGWNKLSTIVLSNNIVNIETHAFYGCKHATIYVENEEMPDTWGSKFNSSYRPVIFGCTLSDDKTYVVSFTYGENNVVNPKAKTSITNEDGTVTELPSISEPQREGYTFGGWKATVDDENGNSQEVVYDANNFLDAPKGTVLYAIWNAA